MALKHSAMRVACDGRKRRRRKHLDLVPDYQEQRVQEADFNDTMRSFLWRKDIATVWGYNVSLKDDVTVS